MNNCIKEAGFLIRLGCYVSKDCNEVEWASILAFLHRQYLICEIGFGCCYCFCSLSLSVHFGCYNWVLPHLCASLPVKSVKLDLFRAAMTIFLLGLYLGSSNAIAKKLQSVILDFLVDSGRS